MNDDGTRESADALERCIRLVAERFGRVPDEGRMAEVLDPAAPTASVFEAALERLGLAHRRHESSAALLVATRRRGACFTHLGGADRAPALIEPLGGRVRVTSLEREGSAAPVASLLDADGLARRLGLPSVDACVALHAIDDLGAHADDEHGDASHGSPLAALLSFVARERQDLWAVVVYALAVGLFGLVTPLAVQALVSTVAFGTLLQPILVLGTMLLGFLLMSGVLRTLQAWIVEVLQRRLFVRVATGVADRLPRLDLTASDEARRVHELVPRFLEVSNAQKAAAGLILDGLEATLTALAGLVVLAFYHPMLLAFDLLLLVGLVGVVVLLGRSGVRTSVEESTAKYELVAWFQAMAMRPDSSRAPGGASFARARADAALRAWVGARRDHFVVVNRQRIGALTLQAAASAGLLVIGGFLVIDSKLTLGQLVAAELIVSAVAGSITKLAKHAESFYDLVTALGKLEHLGALSVERDQGESRGVPRGAAALSIRGSSDAGAADLDIDAGEIVWVRDRDDGALARALRRASGVEAAGDGWATIDGIDVRTLDARKLRERLCLVRAPEIWPTSVLENVRFGRSEITAIEVRRALVAVGAHDSLVHGPAGLTRRLTSAEDLDAADAVSIVLARAILARPGLLMLDGTLDRLSPSEAVDVCAKLASLDPSPTLVVRSRMPLPLPSSARSVDALAPVRAPSPEATP